MASGHYLRNLRPREELALFLCERINCLIDNLRLNEAVLCSCLATRVAPEDTDVKGRQAVTSLMCRALELATLRAGARSHGELDLERVPVPDGVGPSEQWAAPIVRESLQRITRLRRQATFYASPSECVTAESGSTLWPPPSTQPGA